MIDKTLIKDPNFPYPNDPAIPNPIPLIFGTHYTFQKAGVVLAPHTHTDKNEHVTIVVSGSFKLIEAGVERTVKAGDIINLGQIEHGFTALEDNSVLVNVTKYNTVASATPITIADIKSDLDALSVKIDNLG